PRTMPTTSTASGATSTATGVKTCSPSTTTTRHTIATPGYVPSRRKPRSSSWGTAALGGGRGLQHGGARATRSCLTHSHHKQEQTSTRRNGGSEGGRFRPDSSATSFPPC